MIFKDKLLKKKLFVFIVTIILAILISVVGLNYIYAAMIDNDEKTNDFEISDLSGIITEKFTPPTIDTPIKPGNTYHKEIDVTNPTKAPLFVRVLITPEIVSSENVLLSSEIGQVIIVEIGKDWMLGEDGYYYYLNQLNHNDTSSNLFNEIYLSKDLSDIYNNASMKIFVKSETIIVADNQYREAWWGGDIPTEGNLKKIEDRLSSLN